MMTQTPVQDERGADRPGDDWQAVLVLAGPIVVTTMSRTVMHFVDTFMVSRLGAAEAAAVGVGSILVFSLISFGMGTMTAVSTFASQALGRGQHRDCSAYLWQSLWLSGLMGLAVLPLWHVVPTIVGLFGHERYLQALESQYLQITLLSLGPTVAAAALSNFYNGVHRPTVTMFSAVAANLFNMVADYLLIFGALGFPRLEVAGAAVATLLATIFRTLILLVALWWGRAAQQFSARTTWRWDRRKAAQLLRIGVPAGSQFALDIVAWALFLTWLVGRFGTAHIAASQFVWQYLHVSFMPAVGVGVALAAVVGKAIGQGRLDRAERRMRVGLVLCCGYMGTMGVIFVLFGRPLVGLFSSQAEIIRLGGYMMIFAGIFQVFDGMCIAYNNALRGAGDTRWPAVAMAILCWGLVVGAGWLAVRLWPEAQSLGPWLTSTSYIIALAATLAYRWHGRRWQQIDIFRAPGQAEPAPALAAQASRGALDSAGPAELACQSRAGD